MKRRHFLQQSSLSAAALLTGNPFTSTSRVEVLNPQNRVPVSFIIDDSTALVNLAYYGIPQFQEIFPENYQQDWRKLPREIPDAFVLEFLEWCNDHGVKGKYSMVPYPACTGWLHRFIPGWTSKELKESLRIVRELATPDWDIHPEMISHTRVINTKTGLPFQEASPDFMENWEWSQEKSADELGEYIAFAFKVLADAGFDCDGLTTPGGFAHRNVSNLAKGTQYAVQEVFGHTISHFFRDVITDSEKSVQPQIFHARDLDTDHASCSVHTIACAGDWFGGWDGLTPGDPDRFITEDLNSGRLVEVIEKEEPAIFICHWPGIYYNGEKLGFKIFKTVVNRIHEKYNHLNWMKLTEIARYWSAREYTQCEVADKEIKLKAPFSCSNFTIKVPQILQRPTLKFANHSISLDKVSSTLQLNKNTFYHQDKHTILCLDLQKGDQTINEM